MFNVMCIHVYVHTCVCYIRMCTMQIYTCLFYVLCIYTHLYAHYIMYYIYLYV